MGSISESKPYIEAAVPYYPNPMKEYTAGQLASYRWPQDKSLRKIYDLRHHPDFAVDNVGFQLISIESSAVDNFDDRDWVTSNIYPQTQDAVATTAGASRVICFSHLVRRNKHSEIKHLIDDKDLPDDTPTGIVPPSPAVHIDQSAAGSLEILRDNLPAAEAEEIERSGKRWAIINLWRPIKPIKRDPLCVCDARTVDKEDLVIQVSFPLRRD
jgi:hypothetical protein